MDLKPALKHLEGSKNFSEWRKKNKESYFSYAFSIPQEMPDEWQLGFYSKKKDRITTFVVKSGSISIRAEEEVFKKDETKVNEINIGKVNITFGSALDKANNFQSKNYPKDKSIKTIAILQDLTEYGTIWNITYVTESFNTLNMKIDASSGKIIEHNLLPILSFRQK